MKLLSSLLLFISAVTVTATPTVRRQTTSSNSNSSTFHLKTAHASNPAHNDLYVYGYHTGAGFNDAVLDSNADKAGKAILNGSNVQFDFGTEFPWGFVMGSDVNYASWEPVQINTGYGSNGFILNGTQLEWNGSGFGGWLVCDWYHNAPQLFWLNRYYEPKIPSSCSRVTLNAEYI